VRTITAGSYFEVSTEVENASNETLASVPPYPVHFAYHWINAVTGEVTVFDGIRTALTANIGAKSTHRQPQTVRPRRPPAVSYFV
jgi:hypothetical protein